MNIEEKKAADISKLMEDLESPRSILAAGESSKSFRPGDVLMEIAVAANAERNLALGMRP